jgi:hypothetical protein
MSRKSDRVRRPTERAITTQPSRNGHRSRPPQTKSPKGKKGSKRFRSPAADESSEEDSFASEEDVRLRKSRKRQPAKRSRRASPAEVEEVEDLVRDDLEEVVALSSRAASIATDRVSDGGNVDGLSDNNSELEVSCERLCIPINLTLATCRTSRTSIEQSCPMCCRRKRTRLQTYLLYSLTAAQ